MIKKLSLRYWILAISGLFINTTLSAQPNNENWKLVWSDEFKTDGLPDSTKWGYDIGGHGWGNNELQYYTANRTKNARVNNGMLIIEAHREPFKSKDYTSARLVTRDKATWNHGKIEVRAKLPNGLGTWPAIWMLANKTPLKWPDDGEIDIMEHVGYDQGVVHASIHTKSYNHIIGTQKTNKIKVDDCSEQFHTYTLEWDQNLIRIGMDDQYYFEASRNNGSYAEWPFDNQMYLLLNFAVGGNWGGQKGVDATIWPKQFLIDYVRVYQKK
jgi:beta-glucanase (GH16 family)